MNITFGGWCNAVTETFERLRSIFVYSYGRQGWWGGGKDHFSLCRRKNSFPSERNFDGCMIKRYFKQKINNIFS